MNASSARRSGRGRRSSDAGRHRRPAVRPHREREVLGDGRPRVVAVTFDDLHVATPTYPGARDRAPRRSRRSRSGTSERPCVRCAGCTPNAVGEGRVQVDVGRERIDGAWCRHRATRRGVACSRGPTRSGFRACRTRRAHRGSGRGQCRARPRCRPRVAARRAGRGCGRTSGRSSPASTGSSHGSGAPRSAGGAPLSIVCVEYGGQIRRGPSHSAS